jgi:hypothetical protein
LSKDSGEGAVSSTADFDKAEDAVTGGAGRLESCLLRYPIKLVLMGWFIMPEINQDVSSNPGDLKHLSVYLLAVTIDGRCERILRANIKL